jgi:hypothetical protein
MFVQPFGVVCGPLIYFLPFWYVWANKNLATLGDSTKKIIFIVLQK